MDDENFGFDDEQLMSDNEYRKAYHDIIKYFYNNYKSERAARFAILDTMTADKKINFEAPDIYDKLDFDINEDYVVDEENINEFRTLMRGYKKNIDVNLPVARNKECLQVFLGYLINENPYSKTLLQKGIADEFKDAKFEILMDDFLHILMASVGGMPNIITIFNNDVYNRHKHNLSPEVKNIFDTAISKLNIDGKIAFYNTNNVINITGDGNLLDFRF